MIPLVVEWPDAVQAVAEALLLVLAVIVFIKDGLQARRARAERDGLRVEVERLGDEIVLLSEEGRLRAEAAKAEQEALAERVEKIASPGEAAEAAAAIREVDPLSKWYEATTGIKAMTPEELEVRRQKVLHWAELGVIRSIPNDFRTRMAQDLTKVQWPGKTEDEV